MAIAGVSAFFTGIINLIKDKEKSFLIFLALMIGLLVLIFCLSEILFPH